MKFDTHGNNNGLNDLYVKWDTTAEAERIAKYLNDNMRAYSIERSNLDCDWEGELFFEIPFGENLKSDLEKLMA